MTHPQVLDGIAGPAQSCLYILGLLDLAQQREWVRLENFSITESGRQAFQEIRSSGYKMPKMILLYALKEAKVVNIPLEDVSDMCDLLFSIQEETT